ncbi:MAG: class II fumarate hydratase [Thermodesulfovibrionales bacterium]|nr:class II fumarate hydratase [Thermodesulfovibrionales bacterium]
MSRIERDSFGEVSIPDNSFWGSQTQRALQNFKISNLRLPFEFIKSLAVIKRSAALANVRLKLLPKDLGDIISSVCDDIISGKYDDNFPLDVFQTGSATSTNMNINEVISTICNERLTGIRQTKQPIHPNDHVNMCQSSNDVIPSTIRLSALLEITNTLIPALESLHNGIGELISRQGNIIKTGRTHLMDALPITFGQEFSGWQTQIGHGIERLKGSLTRLSQLPLGGTAVGTGVNAHKEFPLTVTMIISDYTGLDIRPCQNRFEAQASMDIAVEVSGHLKTIATSLFKIASDIRLMNSGPICGLNEIRIKPLQYGSSMMPAKVNPVIAEAVRMVCAKVVGNDATITFSAAAGEFELNTMLPVIAYCLLESIGILSSATTSLNELVIKGLTVNEEAVVYKAQQNPILATALVPFIGYDKAKDVIQKAMQSNKPALEIVVKEGYLSYEDAKAILDLKKLIMPDD